MACIVSNGAFNKCLFYVEANYNDLYQWSVDSYPEFWAQVWSFCGIACSKMYEEVGLFFQPFGLLYVYSINQLFQI